MGPPIMDSYIDLGISIFDPAFTLNPYDYLKDLYERKDILGFQSEGQKFLFRFDDCRRVMFDKQCQRPNADSPELVAIEQRWAALYPHRAAHFMHAYNHGGPNMKFKAAVGNLVAAVAARADFDAVQPVFEKLGQGGLLEGYVDEVSQLPMRIFLDSCLLPYEEHELQLLHDSGCAFLKSLENFFDEALIRDCDIGLLAIRQFLEKRYHDLHPDSPLCELVAAGRQAGMNDQQIIANIGGIFLTSISNTVGISSAFILRTLINDPLALAQLKANPELVDDDNVIMELLRRDNHVKALSRAAGHGFKLGDFQVMQGELVYLFFPGVNMDPARWADPQALDFSRIYSGENNIIFGGSFYTCIGRKLTFAFLNKMVAGFVEYLPDSASVLEDQLEVDGSWTAERIITRMPIRLS